jgi:hypothetical protein
LSEFAESNDSQSLELKLSLTGKHRYQSLNPFCINNTKGESEQRDRRVSSFTGAQDPYEIYITE